MHPIAIRNNEKENFIQAGNDYTIEFGKYQLKGNVLTLKYFYHISKLVFDETRIICKTDDIIFFENYPERIDTLAIILKNDELINELPHPLAAG